MPAPALFLDFDGTLVDIAPRPEAVAVAPGLPDALAALRDRLAGALAIITGRPIAAIDGFLAPHRFDAAGLHGAEHRLGGRLVAARPDEPRLRAAAARLGAALADAAGVLIEDKGASVAVHWRLAPERAAAVDALVAAAARELGPDYRLQRGKAVAEIVPAAATKAEAILRFLDAEPYRGRRPIFIGDDLTDEPAFRRVDAAGGLSVRVGPGESAARCRLPSPAALRARLAAWAAGAPVDLGPSG